MGSHCAGRTCDPALDLEKWVFLQLHIGIFGTHRNEKKTEQMILALAWWEKMSDDVKNWVKQCLTCIRFRQRPTRQETGPVKPTHLHPWQEIQGATPACRRPPKGE